MASRADAASDGRARRSGRVLLLGFGEQTEKLAGRLLLVNCRAVRAENVLEARTALVASSEPIRAALLCAARLRAEDVRELRSASSLCMVAVGPELEPADRRAWRKAGVDLALWEPFVDGELRFVLNEAGRDRSEMTTRADPRVPTPLMARVHSATGVKAALVYNVSVSGAYLETPRPTAAGGHVAVEIPLPGRTCKVEAQVVASNVPGNLQRPNLPVGMGVRFLDPDPDVRAAIQDYVKSRESAYRL